MYRGFARWLSVSIVLAAALVAHAQPPSLGLPPVEEGTLARALESGPGAAIDLSDNASTAWHVSESRSAETTAVDPATGVRWRQTRRWLAGPGVLLLETVAENPGTKPARLAAARPLDWSFRLAESQDALRYRALAYKEDTWYGSTYWTGPDWTRVGKTWHHSGDTGPSVRRFVVPRDGRVRITGRVYKLHVDPQTDGVTLAVRHNTRDVWTAQIDGGDAKGVEPSIQLNVRKGDSIRFLVGKRGGIACDTTYWDPTITYDDGSRWTASAGFAATRQPGNPWLYEMEIDPKRNDAMPAIRAFDHEALARQQVVSPTAPAAFSSSDRLPLVLVCDGADRSGLAVGVLDASAWRFTAAVENDVRLRVQLTVGQPGQAIVVPAGGRLALPRLIVAPYRGPWTAGVQTVCRCLEQAVSASTSNDALLVPSSGTQARSDAQIPSGTQTRGSSALAQTLRAAVAPYGVDFDYWAMLQQEWLREDKLSDAPGAAQQAVAAYVAAASAHIEKTKPLLADLRTSQPAAFLADEARDLARLAAAASATTSLDAARKLYLDARLLKRRIVLANPLLRFEKLLFCKRVPTSYSHLVMQYYGWRARPGGGLFVLESPGRSNACRDILGGKLAGGNVLEPRLSWDARKIVFSYVDLQGRQFTPDDLANDCDEGFYHVYQVNVDGSGLRQLTTGPYDDLMPTWLPDGGVAFSSTRRRGYARCFGGQFSRRWHVYTMHRMDGDGGNLQTLSYHDTNEWFPTVLSTGRLLYARWDYIDRDAVTHQNLWAMRPDGTNPTVVWGNATPAPHCAFQAQAIPGSQKIVFTASAHHSITAGSIVVLDPTVGVDGFTAIRRITPQVRFPEAEGMDIPEYYESPWPLGEKYFLVSYSPYPLVWEPGANREDALGIYVLDVFGNRELIYRDPAIGAGNACPLVPRPAPPAIPSQLPPHAPPSGEMLLTDVYRGLGGLPPGSIKQLRIVQIFPKTTHVAEAPPIGAAKEENGRAILGTVPVEPDGSARFTVPAGKPLLFQALDASGFAYQTMRTVTYVQPGEKVACIGCHERRGEAALAGAALPAAARRGPSAIDPGALGGRPFSYMEVVQPVLEAKCVRCHNPQKPDGRVDLSATPREAFTQSYVALCGDRNFWAEGTNPKNAAEALVPRFGARNQVQVTPPGGMYAARGSRLMRLLAAGHYDARLTPEETARLAAWIDMNAIFYGVNEPDQQAKQRQGLRVAMPEVQ